jgi:hypothetical protein
MSKLCFLTGAGAVGSDELMFGRNDPVGGSEPVNPNRGGEPCRAVNRKK